MSRTVTTSAGSPILFYYIIIFGTISMMVYEDAKKNSSSSEAVWAVLVFLFSVLGIMLYGLLGRDSKEATKNKITNCVECGREINTGQEYCPDCGTQIGEGMVANCVECGKEINTGQEYCTNCGTQIGKEVIEKNVNTNESAYKWSKLRKVAATGAGIFILSMFFPYAEVPRIDPVSVGTVDVLVTIGERFANAPILLPLYLPLLFPLFVWTNKYRAITMLSGLMILVDLGINISSSSSLYIGYYMMIIGGLLSSSISAYTLYINSGILNSK